MPIDDRTANLSLAKPNASNTLQDDVARLRSALDDIDAQLVALTNANIATSAEIAVSKLANGAARQLLQTDAAGTGVEWTDNLDIPGTLDVTGLATFDTAARFPTGTASSPTLRPNGGTTTGVFFPDTSTVAIATAGVERWRIDGSGIVDHWGGIYRSYRFGASAILNLGRAEGSQSSPTAISTATTLGELFFRGHDGASYQRIGSVLGISDGAISSTSAPGSVAIFTTPSGSVTNIERARYTSAGNLKIGGTANRATTEGTAQLVLFDGTAPVGTLANGVSLYSASGECRVMDAAGNSTLLSPHDRETNEWIYDSVDTRTGRRLRVDMEKLVKFIDAHFGLGFVQETFGAPA